MKFMREMTCLLVCLWFLLVAALLCLVTKDACLRILNRFDAFLRLPVLQQAFLCLFVLGMWSYAVSKDGMRSGNNPLDHGPETSRTAARIEAETNETSAIRVTAFSVLSNSVEIAAAVNRGEIDVGDTLVVKHKNHSLTNDWVEGGFEYVPNGTTNFTFTVARTNGATSAFYQISQGLRIVAPDLPYAIRADGSRLYVATTNQFAVSTTGGPQGGLEPGDVPTADPLGGQPDHDYDPTNGVVTVDFDGRYQLPNGDAILRLTPTVSFGEPHDYRGTTLRAVASGLRSGAPGYTAESPYPLDSQCLWEAWHEGTNEVGWSCCSCEPSIDCGIDISSYDCLSSAFEVSNDTAYASLSLNGTNIWTGCAVHKRRNETGGTSDYFSADPCGGCTACDSGGCDALDGPSVGSVRFRIALGIPDERHVTGFLWFDSDEPFTPVPQSFSLLARNDANVTDTTSYGVRTVVSSDRGGRTIVVSNITDGVRLAATFTASGANDRSWEITRSGDAMRFRKFSAGGNLMSDVSYALSGGVWSVVDNETGLVETTVTSGDPLDYDGVWRETVRSCGAVTASVVRVRSQIVGDGENAVLRETERMELTSSGWLHSYATYHFDWPESQRNGCLRMECGDDRPWVWHDYDEQGRETFRLEQRSGSVAPSDMDYSIEWLPEDTDAFATVLDYAPHPGDACDTNDCDKVRTESRYVVADGCATLIARTWTRFTRGFAVNGWPTVTETTIRAASQNAVIDDEANEVTVRTSYSSDSASVPYLLRGAVVSETDADGVTETHEYTVANGVVSETVRKSFDAHPFPTVSYSERDLDYGNTLFESTRLASDETVEFDWRRMTYDSRNRLRATEYSDGSAETNDWSCCQLRFRVDRTGAKTMYFPTNRIDRLYHSEEEVSLCRLPHDERYIPYYEDHGTVFDRAHKCVQHFSDAFGRETNATTRVCVYEGASSLPGFSYGYGWRSSELTEYPNGLDDVSVSSDAHGLVTRSERIESPSCETTTKLVFAGNDVIPSKTTVSTTIRGGDTVAEEISDGRWRRERTIRDYDENGCAVVTRTAESSDCGIVTNSVVRYDFLGRVAQSWTPLSCVVNEYDGVSSRIDNHIDTVSGIATTNIFSDCGEEIGSVSLGVSNISRTDYEVVSGVCWRVETQATFADGVTNAINVTRIRLTGLSDALRSEADEYANGALVSHSTSAFSADALILVETNESAVTGLHVAKSMYGRVIGEYYSGAVTWSCFDPYGRVFYRERDIGDGSRRKLDWTGYDDAGDVEEYDEGWNERKYDSFFEEYYSRDAFGNCISTLDHMTNATTRSYDAYGRVVSEEGATYPLRKGYDTAGRMTSLKTTRDGTTWDETQWNYDAATGLCTAKIYADGTVVTNSYTPDGLLVRKETVGGHWSERTYDSARHVSSISYSDGTTESFEYDVFGNVTSASNGVAAYCCFRDSRGLVTNETADTIGGSFSLSREHDEYGRLVSLDTGSCCGPDSLSYDACGRIASISNAEAAVEYAYTPDGLDAGYTLTLSNGVSFTRTVSRDAYRRGLVMCITNSVSFPADGSIVPDASYYVNSSDGGLTNVFAYTYDSLSRPVSRNGHVFHYNARSEVIRDGTYGWLYGYDEIGNWSDYSANELNQYVGTSYDPYDGAVDEYSPDGEMLAYYSTRYTYDAKSRLVAVGYWTHDYDDSYAGGDLLWYYVESVSNVYDHLDRRVQKITPEATHSFFYDGWMLVKEVIANTNGATDIVEYHWGNDLSGTRGGAAGVGGLLYIAVSHFPAPNPSTHNPSTRQLYIPWYDSNGNIMGYWDEDGRVAVTFTYTAFGETSTDGDNPDAFPIRFSTKYHDVESDLYYYTKRFYSPSLHRWLTRDPIEEEGCVNLYAMCGNNCLVKYEALGLFSLNLMWRYPTREELGRIRKTANEVGVYSENFLRQISVFRTYHFPQARSGNNRLFVPKELDRTADLSKLPYTLVQHFDLSGHRERGSLNMALLQIENRLNKEKAIQTYQKFRVSTCRNVFCRTGVIDALTTPFFIGLCENNLRHMSGGELRMLLAHEASHKFHDTQDYYYKLDEKKIYDAYSWGLIYGD